MKNQTKIKTLTLIVLITLISTTTLTATTTALPPETTLTLKSGTTTLALTAADILSMPSYTGIGAARRSGGTINPDSIGSYTGVPLLYLCNLVGGIQPTSLIKLFTSSDNYTQYLSYDQIYNNDFVQYDIETGLIITDQDPLIIVAYEFNGTELTFDSGGPLRDVVVSEEGMATYGNIMVQHLTEIQIFNPPTTPLTCKTTDATGTAQSTYNSGETVYFTATGLSASQTYPIYVVQDVASWTARVPLPTRVSGTATSITTDGSGNFAPTSIYPNAAPGKYDVIVDVDSDGIYDEGDLLINNLVTTGGVFVVPEYSVGALFAVVACFAAFIAYSTLKKGTGIPQLSTRGTL